MRRRDAIERVAEINVARRSLDVEELLAVLAVCEAYDSVPDTANPGAERLVDVGGDGCPPVAEFGLLELAARLGRTYDSVAMQAMNALNLRYRFPKLWDAVLAGELPVWQASMITGECHQLSLEQAHRVDAQIGAVAHQSKVRLLRRVRGLIASTAPEVVAESTRQAKQGRYLVIADPQAGSSDVFGRIAAGDGRFLNATLDRLAAIFTAQGDESSVQQRRARAMGLLAFPARALQVLQQAAQPELTEPDCSAPQGGPIGHTCGQVTVSPDRLLPRTTIHVHIAAESLEMGAGVARVEGIGPVLVAALGDLVGNSRISMVPVIDSATMVPFDSYEIPDRMRTAVTDRNPTEVFPGSARASRSCQLDHTDPYCFGQDRPPGQTRPGNLGPLSSRPHRAKTHAGWCLRQPSPGVFEWRTPLGHRYRVSPVQTEYLGDDHDTADLFTGFERLLIQASSDWHRARPTAR